MPTDTPVQIDEFWGDAPDGILSRADQAQMLTFGFDEPFTITVLPSTPVAPLIASTSRWLVRDWRLSLDGRELILVARRIRGT